MPGAEITTRTRAGRAGDASERKSRTAPAWAQTGHDMGSPGANARPPGLTGASQSGQASVPVATTVERVARRSSAAPAMLPTGSPPAPCAPGPLRWIVTRPSVGGRGAALPELRDGLGSS